MSERTGRNASLAAWFLICTLAVLLLVAGCGRAKSGGEAGADGTATGETGGRRAGRRGEGGQGRAMRASERRGDEFSEMRGGRGGTPAAPAPGGAPAPSAAPATFVRTEGAALSEVEKAEKIRAFAAAYGPLQLVQEKNWDDRLLNWVTFTHDGKKYKMPLVMIYDAPTPESLEGYFVVYPASGSPGKAIATQTITASSTINVPAEPEPAMKTAEAETEAAAPAAPAARQGRRGERGTRRGEMRE